MREVFPGANLDEITPKELWDLIMSASKQNHTLYLPMNPKTALERFKKTFQCRRGGECCTREMSVEDNGIGLLDFEVDRLAKIKGVSREEFLEKFCEKKPTGWSMKYPCSFYDKDRRACGIYKDRPLTCQFFPLDITKTYRGFEVGVQVVCPGGRIAAYKILRDLLLEIQGKKGML